MKEIELTSGYVAIVDDSDYQKLKKHNWFMQPGGKGGSRHYAGRKSFGKLIFMHRQIAGAGRGEQVDHINGNGLDNRRANLRIATKSQNMRNRGKTKANTSGYKGVFWDKSTQNWKAKIQVNYKQINIGRYSTPEEAAYAYDEAAKKHHGRFAKTNF